MRAEEERKDESGKQVLRTANRTGPGRTDRWRLGRPASEEEAWDTTVRVHEKMETTLEDAF